MHTILRAKCVVAGDSAVGKSCLIHTFLSGGPNHQFMKNYNMTLGVDVHEKLIKIPDSTTAVHLFLYDCSGKEFYKDMVQTMSEQPSIALVVFDVTSEESFVRAGEMFAKVLDRAQGAPVKGVLYGNKTDLTNRRRVSPKTGHEQAKKFGLVYFEGSAKEGKGIEEPFFFIVNDWFHTYTDNSHALKMLT